MQVSRSDAIGVCIGLGFKTAKSFDKARLTKKVNELATSEAYAGLEVSEDIVEDEEERERLNGILAEMRECGEEVEVVKELPAKEPEAEADEAEDEESDDEEEAEEADDEEDDDEEDAEAEEDDEDDEEDDEEEEPTPKKPAKEKAAKPAGEKKPAKAKAMGKYSAGPFVRWLGIQGVTDVAEAKAVLAAVGITHLSDQSIKMELKERREGRGPAPVDDKDAKAAKALIKSAKPVPAKEKKSAKGKK